MDLEPGLLDSVQGSFYLTPSFIARMCTCIVSPLGYELPEGRERCLNSVFSTVPGAKQCSRMLPNEITQPLSLLRKCGIKVPAIFRELGERLEP